MARLCLSLAVGQDSRGLGMDGPSYSRRSNIFEKAEWVWVPDSDGIRETDPRGRHGLIPWEDILQVRLAFAPTGAKPWRYLMELKLRSGGKLTVDNVHFAGAGSFEDRTATYLPFVDAVLDRLRRWRPNVKVRAGSSPGAYWLQLLFVGAAFSLLAAVLLALPGVTIPGIAWVKLAIIAVSLPLLVRWAWRSYPRLCDLETIPASALPPAPAVKPSCEAPGALAAPAGIRGGPPGANVIL